MLSEDKLRRINELSKKKKEHGLTDAELKEQSVLREEYLQNLRKGFRNHIEGLKIVDEEGNDVTPDKLKAIQKEKRIHNRHNED
ncbi:MULTISPECIES: DUF896 domain-containing protein [Globicatella]|uniref:UPF0291 protein SAMN02746011_01996 n=1 Tax=Globicatella sulfidifaciens DSM 15739 TaxID=1121925 RepID=A0A1T4PAS2_9LACT|nr:MULTISPECIES: DUF896 domain-containing protein [Globicatella]MDT2769049.1 DUF896 domain-containing protein [Globicatella sulfidifaciens]WPC08352.1 DUF896 domain-containing protein [Globicatella sp. PHS-GS-PNBC-21-1553]SJZ88579.1 Uncharacterized protein YnzC, UPF0291/DUF896 family [Globicatella sulfidifaciens DSM 15739]